LNAQDFDAVTLINNAGTVAPIALADQLPAASVADAVALNLTTPIALTSAFLRLTAHWPGLRRILNISSGAAHTAYPGWSVYGASKAGLDHFSRCVAHEQAQRESPAHNPAHIVSLAPGVIDTDMQTHIRNTPAADFPLRERFVALKAEGQLQSPEAAARSILSYLDHPDFGHETVVDIRQL
jgi:NAD(P)-dependent dehydrogenase (short-subunit alcohol dehydrogenase family)